MLELIQEKAAQRKYFLEIMDDRNEMTSTLYDESITYG